MPETKATTFTTAILLCRKFCKSFMESTQTITQKKLNKQQEIPTFDDKQNKNSFQFFLKNIASAVSYKQWKIYKKKREKLFHVNKSVFSYSYALYI